MSRTVNLPWGAGSLPVHLPDHWRVLGELKPVSVPKAENPASACAESMSDPVGAARLANRNLTGKRIVLVVDDHSRPTPVAMFLGTVLDELTAAGAGDSDIRILIATGVHRAPTDDEIERKLGRAVLGRFAVQIHNAYDTSGLADLGTTTRGTPVLVNKLLTEADLIVCVGAVEPHLLLGFGGGLKMIVPGCAGAETVGTNHMQGVDPDHFDYVGVHGDASPMRQDLEEAACMLGREVFIVNAAMNEEAEPTRFFCGDPVKAHRAGELFIEEVAGLDVPEQADVVLTNSYPMEPDLRQSAKCLGNTLAACRPGGIMMGCLKCETGLGEMPLAKKTLPYSVMRTLLKLIGKNRVLSLVQKAKKGEPVEEIFLGHFGLQMMRRNHLYLFSDSDKLPPDVGRKMGLARSFTDTRRLVAAAEKTAPRGASVWIVPYGGGTYVRSDGSGSNGL